MDQTQRFRTLMLRRLLNAMGVAALSAPALYAAACGGKVVVDASSGSSGQGGGGAGTGGEGGTEHWTTADVGSTGTTTASGCFLSGAVTVGSGSSQFQTTACIPPIGSTCPNQYEATKFIVPSSSCNYLVSVDCGPEQQNGGCCYRVTEEGGPCQGRPFLVGNESRTAQAEGIDRGWALGVLSPNVSGLDPAEREALAEAWTADALLEHASIASFSRFSLELLAVAAPAELVIGAHEAALDEVRHARICFALAQGYRGAKVSPSRFPFGGAVAVSSTLAKVAANVAREGCIGETLAAVLAAEQLCRATDPAVRRALAAITEDESRHAELAWKTVAWALKEGGAEVHAAVAAVFAEAVGEGSFLETAPGSPVFADHGRLDAGSARAARLRALSEVIRPSVASLFHQSAAFAESIASASA